MTNSTEILSALTAVANFVDADAETFIAEMVARKTANIEAVFLVPADDGKTVSTDSVTLRTPTARTEFDSRVLGMLGRNKGSEVSAANLMERYVTQCGSSVTAAQMRASLNRLIEDGQVSYSGIQRGTKYATA